MLEQVRIAPNGMTSVGSSCGMNAHKENLREYCSRIEDIELCTYADDEWIL